jgi:hypothetical protein
LAWIQNLFIPQLSLQGIQISESNSQSNPDLLASVLESREELEEAATEDDVLKIKARNESKRASEDSSPIAVIAFACIISHG